MLPFAADNPPGPALPLLSWWVWAISGHGLLSQSNGFGREMQNCLVPVVLSAHTQGLQPGGGGFNTDKWHIKVAGLAVATAWGLVQMGQPCLSVACCSLRLLQPLFFCPDTCQILSFSFLSLIASRPQSYGSGCSPASSLSPLRKSKVAAGLSPLPVCIPAARHRSI